MQITTAAANLLRDRISNLRSRVTALLKEKIPSSSHKLEALHSPEGLKEKCGVFAYFSLDGNKRIGEILSKSMQRLVHRGDKAAGCAYYIDGDQRGFKLTPEPEHNSQDIINELLDPKLVQTLFGCQVLGHTLYATSRTKRGTIHVQPIEVPLNKTQSMYLVHNGNLPDCTELKAKLKEKNIDIRDCNDSKLIAKAIAYYAQQDNSQLEQAVKKVLNKKWFPQGAYSLLVMTKNKIIAVRDRFGNKPLALGHTGNGIVLASESAAFKPIGAKYLRDIKPGEMLIIDKSRKFEELSKEPAQYSETGAIPYSSIIFPKTEDKLNAMEDIYFMRPDSIRSGKSVHLRRMDLGKKLAETFRTIHPQLLVAGEEKIDYVVPVPESGRSAAEAFATELGLPLTSALVKNKNKRTFISEKGVEKNSREEKIKEKFSLVEDAVRGKNIVLVDDSLVRSSTIKVLKQMFETAGARTVHFAVPAPPILYPNFYGIDTATQEELHATKFKSDTELAKDLKLDTLTFLTIKDFKDALNAGVDTSDFDASYPIPIGQKKNEFIQNIAFKLAQQSPKTEQLA